MWEQIRSNRRRSAFVVTAMGVVLVATGAALGAALGGGPEAALVGAVAALAIWLILWLVSISKGDDIMLRIAGARQIEKQDHPQLVNVVEEMSIASGLGLKPKVYVVDDPSPNAFATGRKPATAAVSVTTGLLKILDRDELQGVVAHEIGHIKNRDVALMTTAGVMLGCIVLLAEVGIRAMWYGGGVRRSRSSNQGGGQAVVMIVAVIMVILAPILAQLIYFALSRRREYLADASAAQFTRYPEGLACALEKLGGSNQPQADRSRVTAPM
ncbi:MAG: M48 family metallopeptidase, partial [Planctomycetota bacterium]